MPKKPSQPKPAKLPRNAEIMVARYLELVSLHDQKRALEARIAELSNPGSEEREVLAQVIRAKTA
jgi:hypothetical protein